MKEKVKTIGGRILETSYTPGSQFVALTLRANIALVFPDKLDPREARKFARGLDAHADMAEAARRAAGVVL